jgi:hypothetical protein
MVMVDVKRSSSAWGIIATNGATASLFLQHPVKISQRDAVLLWQVVLQMPMRVLASDANAHPGKELFLGVPWAMPRRGHALAVFLLVP